MADKPESVHLAGLPEGASSDAALLKKWLPLLEARETVKKAIEEARKAGVIGNPLEASVELPASIVGLEPFKDQLTTLFLVSQVTFGAGDEVKIGLATGVKCARCWLIKTDLGSNLEHPDICVRCTEVVAR